MYRQDRGRNFASPKNATNISYQSYCRTIRKRPPAAGPSGRRGCRMLSGFGLTGLVGILTIPHFTFRGRLGWAAAGQPLRGRGGPL